MLKRSDLISAMANLKPMHERGPPAQVGEVRKSQGSEDRGRNGVQMRLQLRGSNSVELPVVLTPLA